MLIAQIDVQDDDLYDVVYNEDHGSLVYFCPGCFVVTTENEADEDGLCPNCRESQPLLTVLFPVRKDGVASRSIRKRMEGFAKLRTMPITPGNMQFHADAAAMGLEDVITNGSGTVIGESEQFGKVYEWVHKGVHLVEALGQCGVGLSQSEAFFNACEARVNYASVAESVGIVLTDEEFMLEDQS